MQVTDAEFVSCRAVLKRTGRAVGQDGRQERQTSLVQGMDSLTFGGLRGRDRRNAERDQVTDHSHTHLSPALPPGICILSGDVALLRSVSLESCLAAVERD